MSPSSQSDTEVLPLTNPARHCIRRQNPRYARADVPRGVPAWKRALDVACIIVAAPVLVPLGMLVAIGIKLVSRGPVLFKQERIGLLGKRFLCLKFRTMLVNADTSIHQGHLTRLMTDNCPMTKLDAAGDPRLIPGGLWLRSLGLDELPQVINVLRGEMSLVGPRPCLPYEYERYLPRHRQRCATLPGLTGLWQVSGKNRTTFEQMMDLDLRYAKKKSLWLDLSIMAKTIPASLVHTWDIKLKPKFAKPTRLDRRLTVGQPVDGQ